MKLGSVFLLLFFSIFVLLNVVTGIYLVTWTNLVSVLQFMILQFLNIGLAYGITELVMSAVLVPRDLPRLDRLTRFPAVALLYVTCDDVIPELLRRLGRQTYPNCQIFALDDSSRPPMRALVERCGARVVRRGTRAGYKAGNLNHWLARHGPEFEYFVIADADSRFPDSFVYDMVTYAEHPLNVRVAVFQSRICVWNRQSPLPRAMSALAPVWNALLARLGNECDTVLSWGHNQLCRTHALVDIGGFDTEHLAEDLATAVRVIQHGYECKLVALDSDEAYPESPSALTRRTVRWAQQTLALATLDLTGIPLTTQLHLFMLIHQYFIWLLQVPGMVIAVWGYRSTGADLRMLLWSVVTGEILRTPRWPALLLVAAYYLYFLLARLPFALRLGVSARDYFMHLLVSVAASFHAMAPLVVGLVRVIAGCRPDFAVTVKHPCRETFRKVVVEMRYSLLLGLILLAGLWRNPVALAFNFPWLFLLLISPIVVYSTQGRVAEDILCAPGGET